MLAYLVINIYFWLMIGAIVGLAYTQAERAKRLANEAEALELAPGRA
jgi:hypothetical protein